MLDVTISPVPLLARLQKAYAERLTLIVKGFTVTHSRLRGSYYLLAVAPTPAPDKEGGTVAVLLLQNPILVGQARTKETFVLVRDWLLGPPVTSLETAAEQFLGKVVEQMVLAGFTVTEPNGKVHTRKPPEEPAGVLV